VKNSYVKVDWIKPKKIACEYLVASISRARGVKIF